MVMLTTTVCHLQIYILLNYLHKDRPYKFLFGLWNGQWDPSNILDYIVRKITLCKPIYYYYC